MVGISTQTGYYTPVAFSLVLGLTGACWLIQVPSQANMETLVYSEPNGIVRGWEPAWADVSETILGGKVRRAVEAVKTLHCRRPSKAGLASTGSNLVRGQPWSFWWIIAQLENSAAARLFSVLISKMAISDAKGRENQLQREVIGWSPERETFSR